MKILYIGVHEILERDELSLLTEMGHDVFSYQGAYMHPDGNPLLKRPGIPGMKYHPELAEEAIKYAKTKIPTEFFDKFDAVIVMHDPNIIVENWDRMRHKKVIWRSIGQSTPHVENMIRRMRYDGMKIIRMSTVEERILGYIGADAIIPFYKDKHEWLNWNGNTKRVINFTQSLLGRRQFCHYDSIMQIILGFPALIYGSGNTDLGGYDGGELPYDLMKGTLRDNRVFVYGGTWPSPYTLALQEAMMTGIPIVAIGSKLANSVVPDADRIDYYEVSNIIENGVNGFCSDNIDELRAGITLLMSDDEAAKRVSAQGRETAIRLWDKEPNKQKWDSFLKNI